MSCIGAARPVASPHVGTCSAGTSGCHHAVGARAAYCNRLVSHRVAVAFARGSRLRSSLPTRPQAGSAPQQRHRIGSRQHGARRCFSTQAPCAYMLMSLHVRAPTRGHGRRARPSIIATISQPMHKTFATSRTHCFIAKATCCCRCRSDFATRRGRATSGLLGRARPSWRVGTGRAPVYPLRTA